MMFTTIAFFGIAVIGWLVHRAQEREAVHRPDSRDISEIARHARQDLRLIAYLLAGVIVMLGIVADRLNR
jgi:hypothetical protein